METKIEDGATAMLEGRAVQVMAVLDGKATYRTIMGNGSITGMYRQCRLERLTALPIEEQIARQFARRVLEYVGRDRMAAIVAKNKTPEYASRGCCATHDYCDANIFMARALRQATGKQLRMQNDDDLALWERAWNVAIKNNFFI